MYSVSHIITVVLVYFSFQISLRSHRNWHLNNLNNFILLLADIMNHQTQKTSTDARGKESDRRFKMSKHACEKLISVRRRGKKNMSDKF